MGYLILITAILLLTTILFAYLLYKSGEKNRKLDQEIEDLMNMKGVVAKVETKKTKIREKYNEIEDNINNGTESVIMPNNIKKHNHAFRSPCGKGCPLYTES